MVVKRATLRWIPSGQGGRRSGPPPGPQYVGPAKFLAYADMWEVEAFDLIVDLVQRLDDPYLWLADVHFRIEHAPQEWLVDGADFELYEGKKCVAQGRVEG